MEQTSPAQTPPQPNEPQQPPSPSPTPSPSFSLPPSTLPSSTSPNPNPQTSQLTIPFSRPWEQQPQPSHFRHFSSPPFSTSAPPSTSVPPPSQGGGMAIGVPAHHSSPPMPPTSFSSLNPPSFRQQFGGLARNTASAPDSVAGTSTPQARQPIQGNQGMGIKGSMGSGPPMRSSGMALQHQPRPVQSSVRPQNNLNNQSLTSQNLQGHGMSRVPTVGSPGSPSPSTSQSMQPHNQPWLSSGTPGKPPLPTPPFRPQMNPQSLQQRSHIPQQHHHSVSTASQLPQTSSSQNQQQSSSSHGPPENCGQQFPSSRVTQSLPHQQQIPRGPGLGNQKPSANSVLQPSTVSSGFSDKTPSTEIGESCDRIISKRTIQDLVAQIDPSERLDPEVEDILVDIADEFVESITTYGCSLAKHRKSTTLEAKDILLHLERNWNMTLPGFGGDEIKCFRKPFVNDIHRERLSAIKKSAAIGDIAKSSVGQAAGNAKGHLTKAPAANVIGSPDPKMREAV